MDFTIKSIVGVSLVCLLTLVGCTEKNTPDNPTNDEPKDTTIITTDTIAITWNGTVVTVNGSNDSVTVTNNNGYVTINSTVKDISYILSGTGTGQLSIYSTNRLQLQLSNLTLTCSDGPAINNQCKKSLFVVLNGTNSLTDGSTYASSTEDRKAAFFSEGQMIFSGRGSLTVKGNYKHAIASDDYILFTESTGTLNLTSSVKDGINSNDGIYIHGGNITVTTTGKGTWDTTDKETKAAAGINSGSNILISGGNITLTSTGSGGKGLKCDSALNITGGTLTVKTTGGLYYSNGSTENTNYTGNTDNLNSKYYSSPKGIKAVGAITISGGTINVSTSGRNGEGIESKSTIVIDGGQITVNSYDDAINAKSDLTVNGGYIYARATNNDGLDANGNCYIKGGLIYAIGAKSPEVAIDANSEEQKKLYITGGTIIAVGGLERGASISGGTAKQTTSWTSQKWHALYNDGALVIAFYTPTKQTSGGGPGGGSSQALVVYTSGTPTLKSDVSVSGGTDYFGGEANIGCSVSNGSSVTLSNYSNSGGPGW